MDLAMWSGASPRRTASRGFSRSDGRKPQKLSWLETRSLHRVMWVADSFSDAELMRALDRAMAGGRRPSRFRRSRTARGTG